jgi:Tfp pilus assembly protein FimT
LVELAIVLVVMGIVLAFGSMGFGKYMDDTSLRGATDHIASCLLLTRDRAVGTRTSQTMHFEAGYQGTDYRVEIGGVVAAGWKLPKRITYNWASGTITAVTMTPDGRCSASGLVILQNTRGKLDTVSVLSSGLVLTK